MSNTQTTAKNKIVYTVPIFMRRLAVSCTLVLMLFSSSQLYASHPQQHQVVNGIEIYLTIIPAEMLRGHPKEHPESNMHSQTRISDNNQHHIMVTLFNSKNGMRLENASIKTNIVGADYKGPVKKLEFMVFGATWSYGNFFRIPLNGSYKIELEIQQEGVSKVVKAVFQYASI